MPDKHPHPDLHPVPTTLTYLSAQDRFYEWLLSDHPAAAHERARGRLDHQRHEAEQLHKLRAWADRIGGLVATGEPVDAPIRRLHQLATRRLLPGAQQRLSDAIGRPDSPAGLAGERQAFAAARRAEDPDYQYPTRYLGPEAARQPIPPDLGRRPHDPTLHAEVSDRTAQCLAAEAHPAAWMRALAITNRAREAIDRILAEPGSSTRPRTSAPKRTAARSPRTRTASWARDEGGRGR